MAGFMRLSYKSHLQIFLGMLKGINEQFQQFYQRVLQLILIMEDKTESNFQTNGHAMANDQDVIPKDTDYLKFKIELFNDAIKLKYSQSIIHIVDNENMSFQDIKKLLKKHLLENIEKREPTLKGIIIGQFNFMLQDGSYIQTAQSIKQLKNILKLKRMRGLNVLCQIDNHFQNQSSVAFHKVEQGLLKQTEREIKLIIEGTQELIFMNMNMDKNVEILKKQIVSYAKKTFDLDLEGEPFKIYEGLINQTVLESNQVKIDIKKEKQLDNSDLISGLSQKKPYLIIDAKQDVVEAINKKNSFSEQHILIYLSKDDRVRFLYDSVKKIKVFEILSFLKVPFPQQYGLLIFGKIIQPNQTLQGRFKNIGTFKKNIEARIISQRYIFYNSISGIDQKLLNFQNITLPEMKSNTKDEVKKKAVKRASQSSIQMHHVVVVPIMFYTGEIKIKMADTKENRTFYQEINSFLRSLDLEIFSSTNKQENWKYKISGSLIKSLQDLPNHQGTVYRGVNLRCIKQKQGQIIEFKPFTSTSTDRNVAIKFLKRQNSALSSTSDYNVKTLMIIKSKTGKYIKNYSYYGKEEQVLFLPYTQFKITKKTTIQNGSIQQVQLQEVQDQSQQMGINFILWVDDKPKEGEKIFKKLNIESKTTIMTQLYSTKDLKQWFEDPENSKYIENKNKNYNIALITNMKRKEDGIEIKDAGTYAIKFARKIIPQIDIFVYIRNVEGTLIALQKNQIDPKTLFLSNKVSHIKNFLTDLCLLKTGESSKIFESRRKKMLEEYHENLFLLKNTSSSSISSQSSQ